MAAVMGAGKKENDNTFTGLLLGNLPEIESVKKTGILGYEHGEQSYGLFDDGTLFLGKSSKAQIRFDGTTGYLQNSGFGNGGPGLKMHFTGDELINGPYLIMSQDGQMADTTSTTAVRLSTASPYFQIYVPKTASTSTAIIHIGDGEYYFQTPNYHNNGNNDRGGFKIDLAQHSITSYDDLIILGNESSTINFGNGKLVINGNGSLNLSELNFVDDNGAIKTKPSGAEGTFSATGIKPKWMTFVTNVEGAILKGPADVTVSGTQKVYYEYPEAVTTTVNGHASFRAAAGTDAAGTLLAADGSSMPGTAYGSATLGQITTLVEPDGAGPGKDAIWATIPVTVSGIVERYRTASDSKDVTFSGSTTVDVIQGLKIRVTKLSMWALTNDSTVRSTDTIPIYQESNAQQLAQYNSF